MRIPRASSRAAALTLIELLCVLAVIGLLAALLLPALSRGRGQAQRIACASHLRQIGLAFQSFAHDHNGHFPMQVPAQGGGSLEFAENAYRAGAEFYFGFRHFQAVSNELTTPKMLICPADKRLPACNFAVLKNENLSYFAGLDAEFARPTSILAGDRNITNDWSAPATMVRLGPGFLLRWTHELHRFKGNLLYVDGHVEQTRTTFLKPAKGQFPVIADLVLPTVQPSASSVASAAGATQKTPGGSGTPSQPPATLPYALPRLGNPVSGHTNPPTVVASTRVRTRASIPAAPGSMEQPSRPEPVALSTNLSSTSEPSKPEENEASIPPFRAFMGAVANVAAGLVKQALWFIYVPLLLLVVGLVTIAVLRRSRVRHKWMKDLHL